MGQGECLKVLKTGLNFGRWFWHAGVEAHSQPKHWVSCLMYPIIYIVWGKHVKEGNAASWLFRDAGIGKSGHRFKSTRWMCLKIVSKFRSQKNSPQNRFFFKSCDLHSGYILVTSCVCLLHLAAPFFGFYPQITSENITDHRCWLWWSNVALVSRFLSLGLTSGTLLQWLSQKKKERQK